jgi:dienelactone hydrolase
VKAGLLALALVLALSACGGSSSSSTTTAPTSGQLALYNYDDGAPIGYRDKGAVPQQVPYPIHFHDITYLSPRGGYVPGYLAVPPGKGPYPAVVLLHGSGGSRQDLLEMAGWLAGRGMVAMTIDAADARGSQPPVPGTSGALKKQRDIVVHTVVDLRRAVDVLHSLPQVGKSSPVGFLGFSEGAKSGAVLSGVEPRLRAIVLVSAGAPSLAKELGRVPKNAEPTVEAMVGAVDPPRYVGRDTAPLLIVIGKKDEFVPQADLQALVDAAPKAAVVKRYDTGHDVFQSKAAEQEMLAFLSSKLGAGPRVEGAQVGP